MNFDNCKYLSEWANAFGDHRVCGDVIGQECPYCGEVIDKDPIVKGWAFSSGACTEFVRLAKVELRPIPRFNNALTYYIPKGLQKRGGVVCPHCKNICNILVEKLKYTCPQCHKRIDYDKWEHTGNFYKATLQDICPKCGWHSVTYGIMPKSSKKKKPKMSDNKIQAGLVKKVEE